MIHVSKMQNQCTQVFHGHSQVLNFNRRDGRDHLLDGSPVHHHLPSTARPLVVDYRTGHLSMGAVGSALSSVLLLYEQLFYEISCSYGSNTEDKEEPTHSVDSDHAGDQNEAHSTTRALLYFAGGPVDWRSVQQTAVAISTVEPEYLALSKQRRLA